MGVTEFISHSPIDAFSGMHINLCVLFYFKFTLKRVWHACSQWTRGKVGYDIGACLGMCVCLIMRTTGSLAVLHA